VESNAEADIPTQPPPPRQSARVPAAHEDQERAGRAVAPPRQGTQARLGEPRLPRLARTPNEPSPAAAGDPHRDHPWPANQRQVEAAAGARRAVAADESVNTTPKGRFPKSAHLRRHSDFERVYRQGRRHFSGNMTVFYLPGPPAASAAGEPSAPQPVRGGAREGDVAGPVVRIGFTVPRALGPAVERNRMRRRTREAVRHNLGVLEGMCARVDVVINPKKSLLAAGFAQISREVERAFGVIRRTCEGGDAGREAASGTARPARRRRRPTGERQ
jgi:ribonuclease P protein component